MYDDNNTITLSDDKCWLSVKQTVCVTRHFSDNQGDINIQ